MTPAARQALTDACTRFALEQVATLPAQPSWDLDGARELAATFRTGPPAHGTPIAAFLERFGAAVAKSFNAAGPGYLAYIPGGGLYPAALADYLALAVNRFVGVWNPAPVLVEMECVAIDWLRELVGLPAGSRGLLTSGGSMSTLIALVTARRTLLGDEFQDAVLYMSDQTHHCVPKAALLAGFPVAQLS